MSCGRVCGGVGVRCDMVRGWWLCGRVDVVCGGVGEVSCGMVCGWVGVVWCVANNNSTQSVWLGWCVGSVGFVTCVSEWSKQRFAITHA